VVNFDTLVSGGGHFPIPTLGRGVRRPLLDWYMSARANSLLRASVLGSCLVPITRMIKMNYEFRAT